jgi:UDP-N-acetylglucosamine transferase subunit ALG13
VSTFVTVGNATQPFPRMLRAVADVAAQLPQPVFVQFGCASEPERFGLPGIAFIGMDEFERRIAEASLVVTHAGAGSVINAVRAGHVPVVVPRRAAHGEHVDDHQVEFAALLSGRGRVETAHDAASLVEAAQRSLRRRGEGVDGSRPQPPMVNLVRQALLGEALP